MRPVTSERQREKSPAELLTGKQWVRLLLEQPLSNLPNVVFCPKCRQVTAYGYPAPVEIVKCHHCGTEVLRLKEEIWERVSDRIKRAYQRDRKLFAWIRAEIPDRPAPQLEGPLSWINEVWERTEPRGRPQEIKQRIFIATWVNFLSAPQRAT